MTIVPEIIECVETNHGTSKSRIKDGTPKDKIKQIHEINQLYKKNYGEWLWKFER